MYVRWPVQICGNHHTLPYMRVWASVIIGVLASHLPYQHAQAHEHMCAEHAKQNILFVTTWSVIIPLPEHM